MERKLRKIILEGILLVGLTGCDSKITKIDSNSVNECNYKPELLTTLKDSKIYIYCLKDMKININNKSVNLEKYLKEEDNAIDKIIDTLEYQASFSDGGTSVYKSDNITLVKCNTLDGNRDIYIGNEDMQFKANFCKENNTTFVRTYTVKEIEEYNEQQYENGIPVTYASSFKVILSQFQGEETSVIINNLSTKLEENKTYEFEFMLYDSVTDIKNNIEEIFKNSTIVDVRETNKVGLEQINEQIR